MAVRFHFSVLIPARFAPAAGRIGAAAHRFEHPFHLAYFVGLSTGMLDYHMIAAGCAIIGFLAMLPEPVAEAAVNVAEGGA